MYYLCPKLNIVTENPASLHYILTSVTFWGRNMTQWSVNSMLNRVFSYHCVNYCPENDTVVLRVPVRPGMTMFKDVL